MAEQKTASQRFADTTAASDALLESAVKQLQVPINTPSYGGANLSPAQKALDRLNRSRTNTENVINTENARVDSASQAQKSAIESYGQASADLTFATQQRQQQEADNWVQAQHILGASADQELGQRLARLPALKEQADQELATLKEMGSVGFLDDPLEWAYNQIQLPARTRSYNRTADLINSENTFIEEGINRSKELAEFSNKTIPTTTAAMARAQAGKELAMSKEKMALTDIALATTNVDFATKKFAEDLAVSNATNSTTQLQIQEAHNRYSAQIQAIQLAETRINRDLKAAELLTTVGSGRALDVMAMQYDRMMGNPEGTTTRSIIKMLPEQQRLNIAAISTGTFAVNPYQFVETLRQIRPGPNFSPETARLQSWLEDKIGGISSTAEVVRITDKKIRDEAIAKTLNNFIAIEAKNPEDSKIFSALSPGVMIQRGLIPADSPLGKTLTPLVNAEKVPTPLLVSTLAATTTKPEDAGALVSWYYKNNVAYRNTAMNLKAAGIPQDSTYRVTAPGSFGDSSMVLDLTKPADATKYVLMTQRAAQQEKQFRNPGSVPFGFR
jgi:hypothetical protein